MSVKEKINEVVKNNLKIIKLHDTSCLSENVYITLKIRKEIRVKFWINLDHTLSHYLRRPLQEIKMKMMVITQLQQKDCLRNALKKLCLLKVCLL